MLYIIKYFMLYKLKLRSTIKVHDLIPLVCVIDIYTYTGCPKNRDTTTKSGGDPICKIGRKERFKSLLLKAHQVTVY